MAVNMKDPGDVFWVLIGWVILLAVSLGLSFVISTVAGSQIALWIAFVVIGGVVSGVYLSTCFPEITEKIRSLFDFQSGCNSVVECLVSNQAAVGSNPTTRST